MRAAAGDAAQSLVSICRAEEAGSRGAPPWPLPHLLGHTHQPGAGPPEDASSGRDFHFARREALKLEMAEEGASGYEILFLGLGAEHMGKGRWGSSGHNSTRANDGLSVMEDALHLSTAKSTATSHR